MHHPRMLTRLLLALAVTTLAACAALRPAPPPAAAVPPTKSESPEQGDQRRAQAPRPTYNLTGYPPSVRDGYIDGCEMAKRSSYGRKDAKRMAEDAQYAMGWNDGYSICGKR